MSHAYTWVQWNRHKRVYDAWLLGGVAAFLLAFVGVGRLAFAPPNRVSDEVLVIRALGAGALVLLHVVLAIGPLSRLSTRAAPLLYNRRHMGVTMFLLAMAHAALATGYYGGFGVVSPATAVLALSGAPGGGTAFEVYGFLALLILFLMAATSHDFWLANLSPATWKRLHLGVHLAYALVVLHVARGAVRDQDSPVLAGLVGAGVVGLTALHVLAALKERRAARTAARAAGGDGWIDVCAAADIPESRARVVRVDGGERIAVFRHRGGICAVSNVCAHQGGPLGEGKIVGDCITCPWHGYQYRPEDGGSPPPFTEKIHTYRARVSAGRVQVNPAPLPAGTRVPPEREGA